ncbi:MAG: ethylbenzene dehydrogenase-related protein [Chloroflexota bacterium]
MTSISAGRPRVLGAGALALAAVLALAGVPITSAQGSAVFVVRADGAVPEDAPFDPAWDRAPAVTVALSGQLVTPPKLEQPAFPSTRVRAMSDGDRIAVLLEWDDPTMDESTTGETSFSDAAAMQIALGSGTSICMGQLAGGLNIWHWKADWAAAIAGRGSLEAAHPNMPTDEDFPADGSDPTLTEEGFPTGLSAGNPRSAGTFPSSVEDLSAIGFGTLTAQPPEAQNVSGASEYRAGTWRVVMSRALVDEDPNDAPLSVDGPAAVVAFAVWDGSRGDRDGQKSVSTWLSLILPPHQIGLLDAWPMLLLLALALGLSAIIMAYGARQPAVGLGWGSAGPRRDASEPPPAAPADGGAP